MVPKDIFDRRPNAELITRALRSLGVPAEVNHRSDITLEGSKMSTSWYTRTPRQLRWHAWPAYLLRLCALVHLGLSLST
jgi:lipoate-protein ligase A